MTTIYFAGTEDSDFLFFGAVTVTASTANFRSQYVREAMLIGGGFIRNAWSASTFTSFWAGAQVSNSFASGNASGAVFASFADVNAVTRIQARFTTSGNPTTFVVEKVTAAGVKTTLFTVTLFSWPAPTTPQPTMKFDFHINYAVAGSIELWATTFGNCVLLGSFTGDVTTDGVTALQLFDLHDNGGGNNMKWSEVIIADVDTRSFSLNSFAPVANGNTHNFDTGTPAAANVNESVLNDTTLDGSTTAGQIDEYTTAAVATGTYDVVAYGISARMQKGTSGPSKADLAVRTGGADFFSPDVSLQPFWADYQFWWVLNPNTGLAWNTGQIGATAGFNIGIKSVT